jgi:hypothetical protein
MKIDLWAVILVIIVAGSILEDCIIARGGRSKCASK